MKSHLKSLDFHGVVFAPERRGRSSTYHCQSHEGQSSRASSEFRRYQSPSRRRDSHRSSRSLARHRRERRRPESSDSDRSASPQAIPVMNGIGLRQTDQSSSGDLSAPSVVVGAVGHVVNSDAAIFRPATATDLALKVIPLINGLKVQLGLVQLALDVLPAFQIAL